MWTHTLTAPYKAIYSSCSKSVRSSLTCFRTPIMALCSFYGTSNQGVRCVGILFVKKFAMVITIKNADFGSLCAYSEIVCFNV